MITTTHLLGVRMPHRIGRCVILTIIAVSGLLHSACERKGGEEHAAPKGAQSVPQDATPSPITPPAPGQAPSPVEAVVPNSPSSSPPATTPSSTSSLSATQSSTPWTVPAGWTLDPAPRQMRIATYSAPGPRGPVEVAVTRFPGRVGGELANLNRWRGQMELPPIDQAGIESVITRFAAPGFEGYQTRIESTKGVMLAAGVYEAATDQTWFIRATLPDAESADQLQESLFGMARSIIEQ